jgi:DNA repair exonuclease SbcCD ATPase subunit
LIIITHDEAFVHALGRNDYTESYFRVEKNAKGFSQIRQYAIANDEEE